MYPGLVPTHCNLNEVDSFSGFASSREKEEEEEEEEEEENNNNNNKKKIQAVLHFLECRISVSN